MLNREELSCMDPRKQIKGMYRESAISDITELDIYYYGNSLTMGDNSPSEKVDSSRFPINSVQELVDCMYRPTWETENIFTIVLEIDKTRTFPCKIKHVIERDNVIYIVI